MVPLSTAYSPRLGRTLYLHDIALERQSIFRLRDPEDLSGDQSTLRYIFTEAQPADPVVFPNGYGLDENFLTDEVALIKGGTVVPAPPVS